MADIQEPLGKTSRIRRVAAAAFVAALALGVVPVARFVPAAAAQNLGERTVSGTVLSAASAPVVGATVFLENEKTKSIRSFTSLDNGHFHFAQVDKDQDYDLWAEKDGKKSATKTVSSWDARTDFVSDLKFK
jgi:Carboxypeptidase regulatory-like domain